MSIEWAQGPPDIAELAAPFFSSLEELGHFERVPEEAVPRPYRNLLAHDDHMTVTVEAVHNSLVDVQVLDEQKQGDLYTRKIVLTRQSDGAVVLFGIMRTDLAQVPPEVRRDIEQKGMPLGRVLIRHHVLRHVELDELYRIAPSNELQELLGVSAGADVYGRTARIHVAGSPAVELLEIVTPV